MSTISLSAAGGESFEGDGCGVVKIAVSSGSLPVGEMVFGTISCDGVEMPTLSDPFGGLTGRGRGRRGGPIFIA